MVGRVVLRQPDLRPGQWLGRGCGRPVRSDTSPAGNETVTHGCDYRTAPRGTTAWRRFRILPPPPTPMSMPMSTPLAAEVDDLGDGAVSASGPVMAAATSPAANASRPARFGVLR